MSACHIGPSFVRMRGHLCRMGTQIATLVLMKTVFIFP